MVAAMPLAKTMPDASAQRQVGGPARRRLCAVDDRRHISYIQADDASARHDYESAGVGRRRSNNEASHACQPAADIFFIISKRPWAEIAAQGEKQICSITLPSHTMLPVMRTSGRRGEAWPTCQTNTDNYRAGSASPSLVINEYAFQLCHG